MYILYLKTMNFYRPHLYIYLLSLFHIYELCAFVESSTERKEQNSPWHPTDELCPQIPSVVFYFLFFCGLIDFAVFLLFACVPSICYLSHTALSVCILSVGSNKVKLDCFDDVQYKHISMGKHCRLRLLCMYAYKFRKSKSQHFV